MKITEAYVLGVVDDYRVGVGDVEAVFDDGGAEQQVVVSADEIEHFVLEFLCRHLAVGDAYPHIRDEAMEDLAYRGELLYVVVEEEDLASALELVLDYGLYLFLVEEDDLGLDRDTVGRRGSDDAEITRAEQRKLQRPRDRGRRKGEGIYLRPQLAQLFLGRDAEFLFLVDYE